MEQLHDRPLALACMEVWGGNRFVERTVELADLTAWVYSSPAGTPDGGGDVHYLSVCGQSVLSRVVVADVSGHGRQVSPSAQLLHELMREHINTWDQTEFVRSLNKSFRDCIGNGKYATAAILGVLRGSGETAFTNAGHLPPLWFHAKEGTWNWLDEEACRGNCGKEGLPVGLIQGTEYHQTMIQLAPSDILVLYTDGITEAEDASGNMLERPGLMTWIRHAPVDSPEAVGQFLLGRLREFRKTSVDDETIIALQRSN
jgi:phosphoserine phosphatase RsbU/P